MTLHQIELLSDLAELEGNGSSGNTVLGTGETRLAWWDQISPFLDQIGWTIPAFNFPDVPIPADGTYDIYCEAPFTTNGVGKTMAARLYLNGTTQLVEIVDTDGGGGGVHDLIINYTGDFAAGDTLTFEVENTDGDPIMPPGATFRASGYSGGHACGDILIGFNDSPSGRAQVRRYLSDGTQDAVLLDLLYHGADGIEIRDMISAPNAETLYVLDSYWPSLILIASDGVITRHLMDSWWWNDTHDEPGAITVTTDGRVFVAERSAQINGGGKLWIYEIDPADGAQLNAWQLAESWYQDVEAAPISTGIIVQSDGTIVFHPGDDGDNLRAAQSTPSDVQYHNMVYTYDPATDTTTPSGPSLSEPDYQVYARRAVRLANRQLIVSGVTVQSPYGPADYAPQNDVFRLDTDGTLLERYTDAVVESEYATNVLRDASDANKVWLGYGNINSVVAADGRVVTLDLNSGTFTELFALTEKYAAFAILCSPAPDGGGGVTRRPRSWAHLMAGFAALAIALGAALRACQIG